MTKIKDIVVPTKGIGKYFSIYMTRLSVPGPAPTVYWEVHTEVVEPASEADEQPIKHPGEVILYGNLKLTEEEYAQWGTDDDYIVDLMLSKLGFEKL